MKLFTIGPVEPYPETLAVRSKPIPYFRTADFSALVLENNRMLLSLLETVPESRIVTLTASGTGAMEAAVLNCIGPSGKALIVNGGTFGRRFSEICRRWEIRYEEIIVPYGKTLTEKELEPYAGCGCTHFLINLHETSTGQLYDIGIIRRFCRDNGLRLIADAVSTFLCDDFKMDAWGMDAVIFSSQKGLCVSPGMSFVALNEYMTNYVQRNRRLLPLYFDFKACLRDGLRGQTPYTPAAGILLEINEALHRILRTGKTRWLSDIREKGCIFRNACRKIGGLTIPDYPLSNALTPVFLSRGNAPEVYHRLRQDFQMEVNPTGDERLKTHLLRIAHIGNTTVKDHLRLANAIGMIQEGCL